MRIEFELARVDAPQVTVLVRALTALNMLYLRTHPRAPLLHKSGVVYKTQPGSSERFKTIPAILAAGNADCDQLAPWRAAELRVRYGIAAMPEVKRMGKNLWHVYVRYPDGRVEDVSAALGMPVPARLAALGREILRRKRRAPVIGSRFAHVRRAFPA
jgi:hypothetical protein